MKEANQMQDRFLEKYNEYSNAIFRYCYFKTSSREVAKDLMQETFMKMWEYVSENERKIDNMRAFLYKIANNLIIDYFRKRKEISLEILQEKGFDPSQEFQGRNNDILDARFALEALSQVEEKHREVLLLRYIEDLSIQEISKILGETENNISVKIHRALEQAKKYLKTNES